MDKVEPDKLRDNIPRFKPWISSTAWNHWEEFLDTMLPQLATILSDDASFGWPLLSLEAASARRRMQEVATDDITGEDAQVLEQMLDEERVAVEVQGHTHYFYICGTLIIVIFITPYFVVQICLLIVQVYSSLGCPDLLFLIEIIFLFIPHWVIQIC